MQVVMVLNTSYLVSHDRPRGCPGICCYDHTAIVEAADDGGTG